MRSLTLLLVGSALQCALATSTITTGSSYCHLHPTGASCSHNSTSSSTTASHATSSSVHHLEGEVVTTTHHTSTSEHHTSSSEHHSSSTVHASEPVKLASTVKVTTTSHTSSTVHPTTSTHTSSSVHSTSTTSHTSTTTHPTTSSHSTTSSHPTTSTSTSSHPTTSSTSHTTSTSSSTTSKTSSPTTLSTSTRSSTTTTTPSPTTSSSTSTTSSTSTPTTASSSTSSTKSTSSTSSSSASSSSSSASATPTRNSGNRGLSFNDPALTEPFSLSGQGSKVSWAYNWASDPYYPGGWTANSFNTVLTFIPMLWSAASDLTSIWNANVQHAIATYGADSVLAFNEPDGCCWSCGNSCMNVSAAVAAYQQWVQPFAGQVALGAPAVTNGEGEGVGLSYLGYFLGNCTGCTVDFIPIHFYGSVLDPGAFESYVQSAWQMFGKPLWITEFGTTSGSDAQVLAWLQAVLPWLDAQPYVHRYAYFMDTNQGAPYLLYANDTMTDIGVYYNSG